MADSGLGYSLKRLATLLAAATALGCATPRVPAANAIRIDHIIIGVADLDAGVAELERLTGVRNAVGGVHPGQGTRNALMSLGDGTYLEILAPDPEQTVDDPMVRQLRTLTEPTGVGWAIAADDENILRSALAGGPHTISASEPGSRAKPDGSILRWITFEYEGLDDPAAPFFIIWADPTLHPSRTSPGGCRLTHLIIEQVNAERLRRAVAPLQLPVAVSPSTVSGMRVTLACPRGTVTFD
jgi:Glyoxalase-like domain